MAFKTWSNIEPLIASSSSSPWPISRSGLNCAALEIGGWTSLDIVGVSRSKSCSGLNCAA